MECLTKVFKTVTGILVFGLILGGFFSYLAWREEPIIYRFNPESAYVYTFHQYYYSIGEEANAEKMRTEAKQFFDNYSGLYNEWYEFVG
ncbi:MAG: hypothetical protein V5A87_07095 [Candidatus Bipolaricaulota bacterium]|nr:hypothetical protein [Candidatus Bipolaricaulota bacterium]MBS3792642.1 hypothetical protein [Candidatus Bipolaricaulota bacterium]